MLPRLKFSVFRYISFKIEPRNWSIFVDWKAQFLSRFQIGGSHYFFEAHNIISVVLNIYKCKYVIELFTKGDFHFIKHITILLILYLSNIRLKVTVVSQFICNEKYTQLGKIFLSFSCT